jgi:transposase
MKTARLQVGIDFSQHSANLGLFDQEGQAIEPHRAFVNSQPGFAQAKQYLLDMAKRHDFQGVDISGEATAYYWFPFFWQLFHDPELAALDPKLYLLNPRWVHWYKKSLSLDHKSDLSDPFYIADRTRTLPAFRRQTWLPQERWLPLRYYTRLRFHLTQDLVREKNYYQVYQFLWYSAFQRLRPFRDPFGATGRQVLRLPSLAPLAELSVEQLAELLAEWSKSSLSDPQQNARKLQQVVAESFPLAGALGQVVKTILDLVLEHIRFLEKQRDQLDQLIAALVQEHYPEVAYLTSVPGVGPVLGSGIVAEIGDLERFFRGERWDPKRKRMRRKNLRDVEAAVAKQAGLWWPRNDSGAFQAEERHMAKTGDAYLRYYLIEAADHMRLYIPAYRQYYGGKYREVNKHQHKRALVLTARKGVGLFVGLLHHQETYRPQEAVDHL